MEITDYLDKFKIFQPKSKQELVAILSSFLPAKQAKQNVKDYIYEMERRRQKNVDNDKIYKIINRDMFTSVVLSGCSNYERLLKMGEKIKDLKFGNDAIDIGCMNGLFACFLALNNPGCHFVGVDMCAEAIEIANQLANYFQLDNVCFKNTNAYEIEGQYDTVFSSYLIHELLSEDDLKIKHCSKKEAAEIIEKGLLKFTNKVSSI